MTRPTVEDDDKAGTPETDAEQKRTAGFFDRDPEGAWMDMCNTARSLERSLRVARRREREALRDAERYRTVVELLANNVAFSLMLNANDTFAYACADSIEVETGPELGDVVDAYQKGGSDGVLAWMENKSGCRVIKELRAQADRGHAAIRALKEQS